MNLLSGSTWKGAKLRIGEAKPDYRARYASPFVNPFSGLFIHHYHRHEMELNPPPPTPRPKLDAAALKRARLKRRLKERRLMRGVQGREAKDMSTVTLDNVEGRKVRSLQ
jgi:hypothetical protein